LLPKQASLASHYKSNPLISIEIRVRRTVALDRLEAFSYLGYILSPQSRCDFINTKFTFSIVDLKIEVFESSLVEEKIEVFTFLLAVYKIEGFAYSLWIRKIEEVVFSLVGSKIEVFASLRNLVI